MRIDKYPSLYLSERSVTEFADAYTLVPIGKPNAEHKDQLKINTSDLEWYGGISSLDEAKGLLTHGWSDGAVRALALREKIDIDLPPAMRQRRKRVWSDSGEDLDIVRAMQGDPCFRATRKAPRIGGTVCVTLDVAFGGNCDRSSQEMFYSGATAIVLCDLLESAGYSVRLQASSIVESCTKPGSIVNNTIIAKDHGESLRVDAVASVVCHAGVYRTLGFRINCESHFGIGSGLGRSATWEHLKAARSHAGIPVDSSVIQIGRAYSQDAAIAEIKRVLNDLNGASK